MLIAAALEQWAAEHNEQLSDQTLDEVRTIAATFSSSSLSDRVIDDVGDDIAERVAVVFPPSRAERAMTLIHIVADWNTKRLAETASAAGPEPQPALDSVPHDIVGNEATPGPSFVPPSGDRPLDQRSDPASGEPIEAPAFLNSDRVDEEDDVRLYGPQRRSKAIIGAVVAVALLAGVAVLGWLWFTPDTDTVETSAPTTPTAVSGDEADDSGPTTESTTAPTPVPEPTAVLPSFWADTVPILNSGSAEIAASTYAVSPANRAVLTGHTAAITGIAISNDGRVLTSGADRRLVDWGADVTLANPDVLNVPSPLTVLRRTEDQRIVAGDSVGNITILDLVNIAETVVLPIHPVAISAIAELEDGRLAVASVDGDVDVFAIDSPDERITLSHAVEVTGVAGLADGTIATAAVDGIVRLWSADDGDAEPGEVSTLDAPVTALVVLDNEQLAAASVLGDIHVFDAVDGASPDKVLPGHVGAVRALFQTELPDGSVVLASGGDDTTVRLWDIDAQTQVRVLEAHGDIISGIAALPDGRLVSTSGDGTGRVWDLSVPAGQPVIAPHDWNLSALHPWSNDQFVTGGVDGKVLLASTSITAEPIEISRHDAPVVGVSVLEADITPVIDETDTESDADGDTPSEDIDETDDDDNPEPAPTADSSNPSDTAEDLVRNAGDIVSLDAASVLRISSPTGDTSNNIEVDIAPGATALTVRQGSGVATGHADGTVRFHDTRQEQLVVSAHGSGVNDVAALSSGLVVSAGQDMTVRIIDPEDPDTIPVFDLHTGPVDVVIELPDGRIASAGSDAIYVFTVDGLAQDHLRLNGQRSRTISLVALPGDRLISTGEDGRVRLWDLTNPDAEPTTLVDIPGVVNPYLIQSDNGLFVAGAARGYVVFTLN